MHKVYDSFERGKEDTNGRYIKRYIAVGGLGTKCNNQNAVIV